MENKNTTQTLLAFAYLEPEAIDSPAPLTVLIQNKRRDARLLSEPAYDSARNKLQIQVV